MVRGKIPMRKCVATQEMKPKKEMFRIVRTAEGNAVVDPTGKKSGRGAYLSKDKDIILMAKKKNVLSNHLKVRIDETLYDELIELAEKEKLEQQ